jgi:hypothetical protein
LDHIWEVRTGGLTKIYNMKIFEHKIFRAIIFVLLINFENITNSLIPSTITLVIQFVFVIMFLYYFLPQSDKSEVKYKSIFLKYKMFSVLLVLLILNIDHLINKQMPSIFSLISSITIALILVFFFLPLWKKNDELKK